MMMPGRSYSAENGYRYGFNGKENDNEMKGEGNSIDFGARVYDTRIGRWLSSDPLRIKYPYSSPYNFALGNPLLFKDVDGREIAIYASDADYNRIKAIISNAFGGAVSVDIKEGKLSLGIAPNTLTPGELILYNHMQAMIRSEVSLVLRFEDKKIESSSDGSDDYDNKVFYTNIAEYRDRNEACRNDIKSAGSSYWFIHYYLEQWGNQIESENSRGNEMTTPGAGHVAKDMWNLPKERGGAGYIGAISGWHEWAVRYTMKNLGIGSVATAISSLDFTFTDIDIVDASGYYAGTMRTERILDDKTKKYVLHVTLIDRAGAVRGKTKIDINANTDSYYYETKQQWQSRLKTLGEDPSTHNYDDDQRKLYFEKNSKKDG